MLKQIKANKLNSGDTVALISSAYFSDTISVQFGQARLEAMGFRVVLGMSIDKQYGYLAGTDHERSSDINEMFKNKEVKGIFELRGGSGSARLLDQLDYDAIRQNPKVFVGDSDISALLLGIHKKTGLITFHGPVMTLKWPVFTVKNLKNLVMKGKKGLLKNPVPFMNKDDDLIQTENRIYTIHSGQATGPIIGGNLTVLTSMLGTPYFPDMKNTILFVEDVGEDVYRIDRMLTHLKLAGILSKIKGFIFGKETNITANIPYGSFTLLEVIEQHIKPLNIPAWYGAVLGHQANKFTIPIGTLVQIDADKGVIKLLEPSVI